MHDPSDPLDPLLDRLGRQTPPLPGSLTPEVWRRIALTQKPMRRNAWFAQIHAMFFSRSTYAAAFVVGCVVVGMYLVGVRRTRMQAQEDRELVQRYLRLIDPRGEEGVGSEVHFSSRSRLDGPESQLAWMKGSLRLTDAQLERIKALHEQSAPQLRALAAREERMRAELLAFEQERRTEGQIDFLEFARFIEKRRGLDGECVRSTQQLVAAAAAVMTAQQREQYYDLVGPALKTGVTAPSG